MSLWQLKRLSTNEALNNPQPLPENWGSIFGLSGFVDRIHDLSWLGGDHVDTGWFKVSDGEVPVVDFDSKADTISSIAKNLLKESDWTMLSDIPMTSGQKALWIEYRRALREIKLQPGFPDEILWPTKPE